MWLRFAGSGYDSGMPTALIALASVMMLPVLLMLATCLLERVESTLLPRGSGRAVRSASASSPSSREAAPSPRLRLLPGGAVAGLEAVGPRDTDPDATAVLRRVS